MSTKKRVFISFDYDNDEGAKVMLAGQAKLQQFSPPQRRSNMPLRRMALVVFTTLFVDALNGAAGNLVGEVTPGSIYAHIDQSLGPWDQRPVFKTNVKSFVSLRQVQPPIALSELQRITEFFPNPGQDFPLDPTFEPERHKSDVSSPLPDPINTAKFAVLQKFNRVGLVVPVDAPHMWHAAMGSKSCRLTVLGEHYRRLVERGRI